MSVEQEVLYRTIQQAPKIIEGLQTGLYRIYGGVIRVAKGNDKAGSIVAHLMFPTNEEQAQKSIENLRNVLSSQLNSLQSGIETLQGSIGTLQTLQKANLALSGLNLAVSAAGFVIVCRKLDRIDSLLQSHTQKLETLLSLALDTRQRDSFREIASFTAVINTAMQFVEMGDTEQLKPLVRDFNEQYEFTRLVLKNAAKESNTSAFFTSLPELGLLQERFMHLGLFRSFIQQKIGAYKYAVESLTALQVDWLEINSTIVDGVNQSTAVLYQLTREDGDKLIDFLKFRKERIEALEYQSELLRLAEANPEVLAMLNEDNDEILLVAA